MTHLGACWHGSGILSNTLRARKDVGCVLTDGLVGGQGSEGVEDDLQHTVAVAALLSCHILRLVVGTNVIVPVLVSTSVVTAAR